MTKGKGSNMAASVRQRLLNKSRESQTDFNLIFDGDVLLTALVNTFQRRTTALPVSIPLALTDEFSKDDQKIRQWKAFLSRSALQVDTDLQDVINSIANFVMPPIMALNRRESFSSSWRAGGPWINER